MNQMLNEARSLTGLFLGAGASKELGMPLVWDLTNEIRALLTAPKLLAFNLLWRSQGNGYPDAVIDDFINVLSMSDMHYESILGYLETQQRRVPLLKQEYYGFHAWIVSIVSHLLYLRHTLNIRYTQENLHIFEGFAELAKMQQPLWVFSLNYDLVVECLAKEFGIPLNSGFYPGNVLLPRRIGNELITGYLRVDQITAKQLQQGIPFLTNGTHGINLLKIHGSLDTFTTNDGADMLKLVPLEQSMQGVVGALRAANEELIYIHQQTSTKAVTTNEITYADDDGIMQFLRRSILTGAYKFDKRHDQVLPRSMVTHFRTHIHSVSNLICIGYSFGDIHINSIIGEWLELDAHRQLQIVDPKRAHIPSFLLHIYPQVHLRACTASEYFKSIND